MIQQDLVLVFASRSGCDEQTHPPTFHDPSWSRLVVEIFTTCIIVAETHHFPIIAIRIYPGCPPIMIIGYYPHPLVEKHRGVSSVQKEVVYCPDLKFCAFDVAISTDTEQQSRRKYLNRDMMHRATESLL